MRNMYYYNIVFKVMHECKDLFVNCWWRIRYINCCEIFTLQKTEYGLCWSFNSATSLESKTVNVSCTCTKVSCIKVLLSNLLRL